MLRLDRGILRIGDGKEITRSSRVMTEREENVGNNDREREKMSRRGKSDMTVRKGKLNNCHSTRSCSGLTGASWGLAATAEGLPDQVG